MNQEIKKRLEQGAANFGKLCDPNNETLEKQADLRFGFVRGAQTILDNPSEFGLVDAIKAQHSVCDVLSKNERLATEVTHMHYQLSKYKEALERIAEYDFDTKRVSPHTVAKEALKQQ